MSADADDTEPAAELPEDLADLAASLLALRGPDAAAYRALSGEFLVLSVEIELAIDLLLSFWFLELDRELFEEFNDILQRMTLDRKLQHLRRFLRSDAADATALLARVDRVQRLRNKIAHQSPAVEGGAVHFNDEAMTAAQFKAEIDQARELTLDLLDVIFPHVAERRRRWGASDAELADDGSAEP
jgi:hypothetical protein